VEGNFKFRADAGNGAFFVEQQGYTILQYNADDYRKIGDRLHGHATGTADQHVKPCNKLISTGLE
jgi:hypothetical protein